MIHICMENHQRKKFRQDVYFSDDEGPCSPDNIGEFNVTWMGDPLPPPRENRDIIEIDPFENFKFSKRKNGKIPDGSGLNGETDRVFYSDDAKGPNLKLERVFIDWHKASKFFCILYQNYSYYYFFSKRDDTKIYVSFNEFWSELPRFKSQNSTSSIKEAKEKEEKGDDKKDEKEE
jgi:hypothetical protein